MNFIAELKLVTTFSVAKENYSCPWLPVSEATAQGNRVYFYGVQKNVRVPTKNNCISLLSVLKAQSKTETAGAEQSSNIKSKIIFNYKIRFVYV